jgi:hypothetical protein
MKKLPIKNGKIRINDAIKYIAKNIDPQFISGKSSLRDAVKRVREHVKYAYNDKGVFGKAIYDPARLDDAADFFMWAGSQPGWERLKGVAGPRMTIAEPYRIKVRGHTPEVIQTPIPDTFDELKSLYIKCIAQKRQCERRIEGLEEELAQWRRKDQERRTKHADSGKRQEASRKAVN